LIFHLDGLSKGRRSAPTTPQFFSPTDENIKRLVDPLKPSGLFTNDRCPQYLRGIQYEEDLLNAIVAMTAPELFHCGAQATKELRKVAMHPSTNLWRSVYSGMTIIANRRTPTHRDTGGALQHFDLLLSAGDHRNAELHVPDITIKLEYNPGTAVLIMGRALAHSVPLTWRGSRICLAHYIKKEVHGRLGISRPGFVHLRDFDALKHPGYLERVDGILSKAKRRN